LSLLSIAPMILVTLFVERYITRGLVVGAIK
jgi:ABC-type glycerol-3-phosphate transport system permease component